MSARMLREFTCDICGLKQQDDLLESTYAVFKKLDGWNRIEDKEPWGGAKDKDVCPKHTVEIKDKEI
jgi:hypothetical protein